MSFLREQLDRLHPLFDKGGKLEKFYAVYEAIDTFTYSPGEVTQGMTHVRDALDLKRMMIMVVYALIPCTLMAMWNTGYQANTVLASLGQNAQGWRADLILSLGLGFSPTSLIDNFVHGALYFVPVYLTTMIAGGTVEAIFSIIRKHEINEGFLVTGMLFPLTLPATIPLWQVAVGIIFGVVFGKEVFGGTGKNFINVALLSRAFLYFAYPIQISGDAVWVAVDGYSAATPLAAVAAQGPMGIDISWTQAFLGLMPGSMGETSALAALIGAFILIWTGVGSWKTMAACIVGLVGATYLFNFVGSETNPAFALGPEWHLVIGGFAFGAIFMATDPVSSAMTDKGKWAYGILIGVMTALIRVVNPAFPEGIMLAILFANVFAPLLDWFVVNANIKRRQARTSNV